MTDVLQSIANSAIRVGAPVVSKLLSGGAESVASDVATMLVKKVSEALGVSIDDIPKQPPTSVDSAVLAVDADMAKEYTTRQVITNKLLQQEMNFEPAWTWAWRPAWMWFLMVVWGSVFILFPLVNALLKSSIPIPDLSVLSALTIAYLGLYMGGNTIKSFVRKDG